MAPRWTIDTQLGGSNFLTYKDNIVDYVEKDKKRSLVFRLIHLHLKILYL